MVELAIPNINQKLQCNMFIHVALAPKRSVLDTELPIRYKIKSDDQEFEADMIDFLRIKLKDLPSVITYPSHGIPAHEFRQARNTVHPDTEYAVFIYKKVN